MVSRKLMGAFACFDFFLLAAGVICVVLSIVWRAPDVLMNMTISKADLTAGLALGISLLITFAVSIAAVVQANHITIGFVVLNYFLLADSVIVLSIGSFVWFFTLRERDNFHKIYAEETAAHRIFIQDKFKCCGYFNASDLVEVGGNYCNQTQVNFLNTLDWADDNNAHFFCVKPVTAFADMTLNNIFSTAYGFMAVLVGLVLCSMCVVNKRKEAERFKKIDAKRGGARFV